MRRHLVPSFFDFDTRVRILEIEIRDDWDEPVKASHRQNRENLLARLRQEFGVQYFDQRLRNFIELGSAPFSILSYHNAFFRQAREAFIYGAYFPSLTATCALGERILNHLILDLRTSFKSTPQYKKVHRKESFDDWERAIGVLTAWNVLREEVAVHFRELAILRHRSVHFNPSTYDDVRRDALAALGHMRAIVEGQFSSFGPLPWFIQDTLGACFIKKAFETDPFVKTFYLPQCPLVGPLYAIDFHPNGLLVFDREEYPGAEISDEEFRDRFNSRDPKELTSTALPATPGVRVIQFQTAR
jgi:hypothetical protein